MAPTFGATPWQPQAPELARRVAAFWADWNAGRRAQAVGELRDHAERIEQAPSVIRGGVVQQGFVTDAASWLDATQLWGKAMVVMLDALSARSAGDTDKAQALLAESGDLQARARAVRIQPARNTWGSVQPKVGDGVLDTFLSDAAGQVRQ
jgi:hyaluronoglucosaminidase